MMSTEEKKRMALFAVFVMLMFGVMEMRSSTMNNNGTDFAEFNYLHNGIQEPPPKIAWLMSFPNSGTSYTLALLRRVSNSTMGTNYGSEHLGADGNSVMIHEIYPNGPFRTSHKYPLPKNFVLTKTHCLGYCVNCQPVAYVVSSKEFERGCRTGTMYATHGFDEADKHDVRYNSDIVHKAVHLLRDPFDNIVSRFHLGFNKRKKTLNPKHDSWLYEHPQNINGFRTWCTGLDHDYRKDKDKYFAKDVLEAFHKVPCHSEFFRYVHWHNNALTVIADLELPVHTIFYEDYGSDYKGTLGGIMEFLDYPYVGHHKKFHSSNYTDYYTEPERTAIAKLMKNLATKETYALLSRYLDEHLPYEMLIV